MDKSPHSVAATALRELLSNKRRSKHLHQMDVANALQRPQSFVSKYENGERKIDVIDFIQICRSMNLDPASILNEYLEIINSIENQITHPSK